MSLDLTDILIECGCCGAVYSENEFMPNGELGEQLVCPDCGETRALTDYEEYQKGGEPCYSTRT